MEHPITFLPRKLEEPRSRETRPTENRDTYCIYFKYVGNSLARHLSQAIR